MAYTIIRSNGNTLTTIQDGTINTVSTSLGLPGRNYAGYGQTLDTNFVRLIENFASDAPPINPLKGQLWFNTLLNTLNVCPADGTTNAAAWATLTTATSGGASTLGNVTITGNIDANNLSVGNSISTDTITVRLATVSDTITGDVGIFNTIISNAAESPTQFINISSNVISTGDQNSPGELRGTWTVVGSNVSGGNALSVTSGNIAFSTNSIGIKCDNYMYANGAQFNPSGTYNDSNVADYLTRTGGFSGNIKVDSITTSNIKGGGTISGLWTLGANSRIQATYADLAERYEADAVYPVGTVVEIGGAKEITSVKEDATDEVFGVVSDSYAYLLNSTAGTDETHPAIALTGRVKVTVSGKVTKGQRLISAGNGAARAGKPEELTAFNTIGRALANKDDDGVGLIEAIVFVR